MEAYVRGGDCLGLDVVGMSDLCGKLFSMSSLRHSQARPSSLKISWSVEIFHGTASEVSLFWCMVEIH